MSQNETNDSITALEAVQKYNIMRLASRIHDLQNKGYIFDRTQHQSNASVGKIGRYTKYRLIGRA